MGTRSTTRTKSKAAPKAATRSRAARAAKTVTRAVRPAAHPARRPTRRVGASRGVQQAPTVSKPGAVSAASRQDLMTQLDQWFERSFGRWLAPALGFPRNVLENLSGMLEASTPRVEVIDRDADVLVRAALPGVEKKDLQILVSERALTIRAVARSQHQERQGALVRQETSHRELERTVALPSNLLTERARATLENGMLQVAIPRAARGSRRSLTIEG